MRTDGPYTVDPDDMEKMEKVLLEFIYIFSFILTAYFHMDSKGKFSRQLHILLPLVFLITNIPLRLVIDTF